MQPCCLSRCCSKWPQFLRFLFCCWHGGCERAPLILTFLLTFFVLISLFVVCALGYCCCCHFTVNWLFCLSLRFLRPKLWLKYKTKILQFKETKCQRTAFACSHFNFNRNNKNSNNILYSCYKICFHVCCVCYAIS